MMKTKTAKQSRERQSEQNRKIMKVSDQRRIRGRNPDEDIDDDTLEFVKDDSTEKNEDQLNS